MSDVCANSNDISALSISKLNGIHFDSTNFQVLNKEVDDLSHSKGVKHIVHIQKGEYRTPKSYAYSPKRYAANGIRRSPRRWPFPHKTHWRKKVGRGYDGYPLEAFQSDRHYQARRTKSFSWKLNCNAPEFSPSFNPSASPAGLNPSAPEFSPLLSSIGLSPLAKPFTPAAAMKIGLSPLAAPFVPKAVPEVMTVMDLGPSLRSVRNASETSPNIASFARCEKLYEIYDFA